jgi:hypothetical protein
METKHVALCIIFFISLVSFLLGITNSKEAYGNGCKYTTVLSRINVPYIIGCELSRPRFEPYNPK